MKNLLLFACSCFISVTSSLVFAHNITNLSLFSTINIPSAQLGGGYSSDNGQPIALICLNKGTIEYSGSNTGLVELTKLYDLNTVMQQLNIEADAHVKIGMFSGDDRADFLHYLENDELSESLIYRTSLSFKDSNYHLPSSGPILNPIYQPLINDGQKFRSVCGDSYVSQMHYGAYLYIVYQLHFLKQEDREKFDDTFSASFSDFGSFTASMQQQMDKLNIAGNLHIFALQAGGDPQYLSDIFKSPTPSVPSPISQCSFDDLKACDEVTTAIMNYVTTTDPNSFPNQLKLQPGDIVPQNAAATGLELIDYSDILPVQDHSELTPDIIAARDALGVELTQIQNELQRAQYLLTAFQVPYVYDSYLADLNSQISNLQNNEIIIQEAGRTCFNDLSSCLTAKQQAESDLLPIDKSVLTPPESISVTVTDNQGNILNQQLFVAIDKSPNPESFLGVEISPALGNNQTKVAIEISEPNIVMVQRDPNTGAALTRLDGGDIGKHQYRGTITTFSSGEVDNWIGTINLSNTFSK